MEIVLNGRTIYNKEMLHEQLKNQGAFPDYYGNNLDALYDVLSTGQWHIIIQHLTEFDEHLKEYSLYFFDVLSDLKEDNEQFSYEIEEDDLLDD